MTKSRKTSLLITQHKQEIIDKVAANRVVIIVGQTGSGKSTQVPQYLHYARNKIGMKDHEIVACLHPRSVAAITLAERVAEETKTRLGMTVGYRVRFYRTCNPDARIVFMTAGFMSRLLSTPAEIERYGVVIVDEAHERSLQNDFVMGQMKLLMARWSHVRLVVMSATMDESVMLGYYPGAAVVRVARRDDRVEVLYRPIAAPGSDYVATVLQVVKEALASSDHGNVLVFLPSEEKVLRCVSRLHGDDTVKALVLPLFGAMDKSGKDRVFRHTNRRMVVVATNIAETSLTIAGVRFVVDSGLVKRVRYDHERRVEHWITERVSVSEAEQRRGRTGRTGTDHCICYRLFDRFDQGDTCEALQERLATTEGASMAVLRARFSLAEIRAVAEHHEELPDVASWAEMETSISALLERHPPEASWVSRQHQVPEVLLANPDSLLLSIKATKLDPVSFPFLVHPTPESLEAATLRLMELSLLHDDRSLTPLGVKAAQLPLSPALAKVAVLASESEAREDVLISLAMLQGVAGLLRSSADAFLPESPYGDMHRLVLLFEEAERNDFSYEWCKASGVPHTAIMYTKLVYSQLINMLPSPFDAPTRVLFPPDLREQQARILYLTGFFGNLAVRVADAKGGKASKGGGAHYELAGDRKGCIYQRSCVDKREPLVLSLSLRSSMSDRTVTMKDCVVFDRDTLLSVDPRQWRIRANLWRDVLALVLPHQ